MPQSLSSVLVHLVFSTKNREPWLRGSIEGEMHVYEHHQGQSFQDEFRELLTRYEIPFDERYVWD